MCSRRWRCSGGCDWDACDACHALDHGHPHELIFCDGLLRLQALCYVLPQTTITHLKCVAEPTPKAFAFVSAPVDTTVLNTSLRSRARSLQGNRLGPEGGAALAEGIKGNSTLQSLE